VQPEWDVIVSPYLRMSPSRFPFPVTVHESARPQHKGWRETLGFGAAAPAPPIALRVVAHSTVSTEHDVGRHAEAVAKMHQR
jgi:hypothetical protein